MMRSQKSEESNCLEELNSIREGRALIGLGSSYLGSNQEVQWLCPPRHRIRCVREGDGLYGSWRDCEGSGREELAVEGNGRRGETTYSSSPT